MSTEPVSVAILRCMLILLAVSVHATGTVLAQGLIDFYNNSTTLVSDNPTGTFLPIDGGVGNYEFALLTSPVGSDMFSFAGIYATNTTTSGMFTGGAGISVPGWAAGTQRDFVVYGWRASVGGVTYNPSWLNPNLSPGPNSPPAFGLSDISTGVAGGVGASGTVPALDLFGPGRIQTGFLINGQLPAPEPSSAALLGLGAAVLLVQSHRSRRRVSVSKPTGHADRTSLKPSGTIGTLLCLAGSLTLGSAQGLVNFYNTPGTLISDSIGGQIAPIHGGPGGYDYEFALLTSPVGAANFSFAGVYGTNSMAPGMFTGGAGVAVPGWASGTARDFVVFGWNASFGGTTYDPSWLKPDLSLGTNYPLDFGISSIGAGTAGGVTASGTAPTLDIFGGPTGIESGFIMGVPVPEPSNVALSALGAVFLVGSRWRGNSGKKLRFF